MSGAVLLTSGAVVIPHRDCAVSIPLPPPVPRECARTTPPPKRGAVVKACACGRDYTREEFDDLPFVGWMPGPEDGQWIRLANCVCGSTVGIVEAP